MSNPPTRNRGAKAVCRACGEGTIIRRRVHRMSLPVVTVGWLLLVSSLLGGLAGVLLLLGSGSAGWSAAAAVTEEARSRLAAAAVPEPLIGKIVAAEPLTPAERASLTPPQQAAADSASRSLLERKVRAGAGMLVPEALSLLAILLSAVAGLFGWLLTRKKHQFKCNRCHEVLAQPRRRLFKRKPAPAETPQPGSAG